jgi:S-DNA-T family DNA segregation ATPase FtsK/SpoIIIE
LVAAIGAAHRASGAPNPRKPWPDPLPERLTLDDLADLRPADSPSSPDDLSVALADNPEAQRRYPISWPMHEGNLLLYGVTGSGTTTTLASLGVEFARTRSADRGHLYVLDFAAGGLDALAGLPHCGAVVSATDRERQIRLIRFLRAELDRRRDLSPSSRADEPRILVLVDNVEGFRAAYDDPDGAAELDRFARLFADGPEVGIVVAMTSTRIGGVPHTLATATPHKWLFRLADPTDYSAFAISRKQVPTFVPGRFLVAADGIEAHVALPGDDLAAEVDRSAHAAGSEHGGPRRIQTLPANVDHDEVRGTSTVGAEQWSLAVGRRDTDLGPATLTLYEHEHGLVAGPARSGRSTALLTLASSARDAAPSTTVLAVATRRSPLRESPLVDSVVTTADAIGEVVDRVLATSGPTLVLVDDADTLDDADGRLAQLLANARPDVHVVIAGRNDVLRSLFGHWTQTVRRSKAGVLLQPDPDLDGDLLGARLPRKQHVAMGVGRGYVISDATATLVQVAEPLRVAEHGA